MKKEELEEVLHMHKLWLDGNGGKRANLIRADLRGANLREVKFNEETVNY